MAASADQQFTPTKRETFLKELSAVPNISRACRIVGISRRAAYNHKNEDEEFAKDWEDAFEAGIDRAERELYRRAVEGTDKPVIYQGEITNTYKEYSDTALIFLLKGRRKDVFSERHELAGPDGGPLKVEVTITQE